MYRAITQNIQITVEPEFLADRSSPEGNRYFWAYTIEITNLGEDKVQLTHRHWRITDANGKLEQVRGSGVVGEQPKLGPGESFRYTSGCPLTTPSGIMVGTYRMLDEKGREFDVDIPAFSLDSPYAKRILN
ncbi:MAG: Co2+/Mg2+ efflux protein ApaG [Alphaproteobacteria bacterium]|nr:Co2+/Mg2+ efflux protein ApaG [Alphaproteobacteria bacterium]